MKMSHMFTCMPNMWIYNASSKLKDLKVRDKFDLRNQERSQEKNIKEAQPKLENKKAAIIPVLNVLNGALRAEKQQQRHQERSRYTKAFRDIDFDDEMQR